MEESGTSKTFEKSGDFYLNGKLGINKQETNKNGDLTIPERVQKKYQEAIKDFKDVTEQEYKTTIETMAWIFVENEDYKYHIKLLDEQIKDLMLQNRQSRVTLEQRQVLKRLGVSIHDILTNCPTKEKETVSRLEVLDVRGDSIKVQFKCEKGEYIGYVTPYDSSWRDENAAKWELFRGEKLHTKRKTKMTEKVRESVQYDVLRKTFKELFKQETNKNEAFQYLY